MTVAQTYHSLDAETVNLGRCAILRDWWVSLPQISAETGKRWPLFAGCHLLQRGSGCV